MKKHRRIVWTISAVFLLFAAELYTNVIEQCLGRALEWTNGYRPRSGAVWERALLRQAAIEKMGNLHQMEQESKAAIEGVSLFSELVPLIEAHETLIISREKFVALYQRLTRRSAAALIPPLKLLRIIYNGSFRRCYFQKEDDTITLLLLNEQNETLHQKVVTRTFFEESGAAVSGASPDQERFVNKAEIIVTRGQFFQAFNAIESDDIKRQIINDPFQLLLWGNQLLRVAILPENETGDIPLIFEVRSGVDLNYITFQSRALAVYYLIQQINELEGKTVR